MPHLRFVCSFIALFLLLAGRTVEGCDLCGCFTPQMATADESEPLHHHGVYAAVAEQFTHFGTLQVEGKEVSNPTGQYLDSSITQWLAGYQFTPRLAAALYLPLVERDFKRPEGFRIDRGNVGGLGDMTLLLRAVAWSYSSGGRREVQFEDKNPVAIEHPADFSASIVLLGGLKFPTGATSRLKEEFHENEIPGAPPSGIHGHDLTLGTGSYDGIFGGQPSVRYRNLFFDGTVLFTLRGDGAHQYHFANDLTWDAGPGCYCLRTKRAAVGLQLVASGEYKATDRFRGTVAGDTGITSVFCGPRVIGSFGRWSAQVEVGLPVLLDNTELQAVPDYRVRGGISCQF